MKLRPKNTQTTQAIQTIQSENNTKDTKAENQTPSIYAHPYTPRENNGGNFCGHYPNAPRFILTSNPFASGKLIDDLGDNRRSAILYTVCERIRDYYDAPESIPVFNTANRDRRSSERQRNSSRREALIALCTVMVMNMDLTTFKVGYPSVEGFVSRSLEWLAAKAKLSLSRAKRAMSDLVDAGIISSYQYRELLDVERKEYKYHIALRTFHIAFFELLGISRSALNKAREYANNKLTQAAKTLGMDKKVMARLNLEMHKIANRMGQKIRDNSQLDNDDKTAATIKAKQFAKRRTEIVIEVMQANPTLCNDSEALKVAVHQRLREEGLQLDP